MSKIEVRPQQKICRTCRHDTQPLSVFPCNTCGIVSRVVKFNHVLIPSKWEAIETKEN